MCLGIPGQIIEIKQHQPYKSAWVDFAGIVSEISLACTPEAKIGDYVVAHVGLAIGVVDEQAAQDTLDLMTE